MAEFIMALGKMSAEAVFLDPARKCRRIAENRATRALARGGGSEAAAWLGSTHRQMRGVAK